MNGLDIAAWVMVIGAALIGIASIPFWRSGGDRILCLAAAMLVGAITLALRDVTPAARWGFFLVAITPTAMWGWRLARRQPRQGD
jgi:hypothetical protein